MDGFFGFHLVFNHELSYNANICIFFIQNTCVMLKYGIYLSSTTKQRQDIMTTLERELIKTVDFSRDEMRYERDVDIHFSIIEVDGKEYGFDAKYDSNKGYVELFIWLDGYFKGEATNAFYKAFYELLEHHLEHFYEI